MRLGSLRPARWAAVLWSGQRGRRCLVRPRGQAGGAALPVPLAERRAEQRPANEFRSCCHRASMPATSSSNLNTAHRSLKEQEGFVTSKDPRNTTGQLS